MGLAMNSTSPPPPRTSESSPHWFQQHCRYRFEGQHPHQLRSQLTACTAQIIQNLLFQRYLYSSALNHTPNGDTAGQALSRLEQEVQSARLSWNRAVHYSSECSTTSADYLDCKY